MARALLVALVAIGVSATVCAAGSATLAPGGNSALMHLRGGESKAPRKVSAASRVDLRSHPLVSRGPLTVAGQHTQCITRSVMGHTRRPDVVRSANGCNGV